MSTPNTKVFRCLIIEDDADFASMESMVVASVGGVVTLAHSLSEARVELACGRFDLVILDNRLPDGTGHEFCPQLMTRMPEALVIMITGVPELARAVALTRNGLFDYLAKPVDLVVFRQALERARLRMSRAEPVPDGGLMVGEAPMFQKAVARLRDAARHPQALVLLLGETGTGKDVAARQLHAWSHPPGATRAQPPFVPLNCSAVPSEMFEAELFGSERGAYTGADRRRAGMVEAAESGTLFLDEVGDVPMVLQSKLLRFLESREYRSLGGGVTRYFTGRIVAATNRDLPEEVRRGRFRQDLLYRLDVIRVEMPPLRDRREDLPMLISHLLRQLSRKYDRRCPDLNPADAEHLMRHDFPGNVRELRNVLERSLLHTPEADPCLALDRSWLPATASTATSAFEVPPSRVAQAAGPGAMNPVELQEFELYKRLLVEEGGAIRRTAARLGVSHQVVLRRLRRWPELRELARTKDQAS